MAEFTFFLVHDHNNTTAVAVEAEDLAEAWLRVLEFLKEESSPARPSSIVATARRAVVRRAPTPPSPNTKTTGKRIA